MKSSHWRPDTQACKQGGGGRCAVCTPTPKKPKRSAWWDRKRYKMIQNTAAMVGLTVSIYFQQFADLRFQIFFRGSMPEDTPTPKSLVSSRLAWPVIPWLIIWPSSRGMHPPWKILVSDLKALWENECKSATKESPSNLETKDPIG